MYNLVLKDVVIQRLSILIPIIVGLLIVVLIGGTAGNYAMAVVGSTFLMMQSVVSADDKNNTQMILNSLPIKRSKIVMAKYISSVLFSLGMLFMMTIFTYVVSETSSFYNSPITFANVVLILGTTWIVIAIFLPLNLGFGFHKMQNYNSLIFILSFVGSAMFIGSINPYHKYSWDYARAFPGVSLGFLAVTFLILAVIILLASLFVSLKLYEKREF